MAKKTKKTEVTPTDTNTEILNKSNIKTNREFLLLYDAILCNPNGDSDAGNLPRMDFARNINLVSDVRVKRDIRTLLKQHHQEEVNDGYEVFVDLYNGKKVSNQTMLTEMKITDTDPDQIIEICKNRFIDIRLFGHAMAVNSNPPPITGPVQISWGFSLHPVTLVESKSITSIMSDGNSTFGDAHKVYYSAIAHYGTVSKINAVQTGLTDKDLELFREALINGVSNNLTTSKLGKTPLLYIEIEHEADSNSFIGDFRRFIKETANKKSVKTYQDISLDFSILVDIINNFPGIKAKQIWSHPSFKYYDTKGLPEDWPGIGLSKADQYGEN